ncbi:MAG: phosphoribosyl-ATP diphosphatase [Rickettsiales bacterium]|nr:phosphoribosyl-ATP diphosphatase [Rickettsiales bacterium]
MDTLNQIYQIIDNKKNADPEKSYVASLLGGGVKKISKKVVEEAGETIIASLAEDRSRVISESADLIFHLLVLLYAKKVKPSDVMKELEARMGISGLDEKALRNQKKKSKKNTKN